MLMQNAAYAMMSFKAMKSDTISADSGQMTSINRSWSHWN